MSREIDLTQPLSDEDREYLESRSRLLDIAKADANEAAMYAAAMPDGNEGGQDQRPDATDASKGQNADGAGAGAGQDQTVLASQATEHTDGGADGDEDEEANYGDEEAWDYDDLKAEVKARKADGAEGAPALNSSRDDLVAWLHSDDAK